MLLLLLHLGKLEEAQHSAQQCQLDAEQRIRNASLESESRATELWSEIDRMRGDAAKCEALEKQVSMFGRAKVAAESAVRESQRNLERCQQKVEQLEAQESRKHRQDEELSGLRRENEEQQEQIKQICMSLQQFQNKNEALKRDNRSLEEKVTCMEGDLDRVADQHAKLMGHTNQKQKIRHTMKLKEENNQLRFELKSAKRRLVQVEIGKRSESCFDALAAFSSAFAVGGSHLFLNGVSLSDAVPGAAWPGSSSTTWSGISTRALVGSGFSTAGCDGCADRKSVV